MEKLVFFVDDDKMTRNLLEYTLSNRHDFAIKTFSSGEDCLKSIDLKPDMIVIDHYFRSNGKTDMSGLDILLKIRNYDRSLPVVILSGFDDSELKRKYLTSGACKFIPKNDYFIDELIETIDERFA
jgi:FixJ family two-component response regulator